MAPSLKPAFRKVYEDSALDLDPCFPHLEELAVGSFEFGSSLVPDTELARSAFYHEWMAPQGFLPVPTFAGVIDRDWEHGTSALRVFWPRGARPCGRAEQHLGELLMPRLRSAVKIHFRTTQLEAERRALASVFDKTPLGLILLDDRGRVCGTNRAADRILARRDGLVVDSQGLRAVDPGETETLRRLIAQASRTDAGIGCAAAEALPLQGSGLRPLQALVRPIAGAHRRLPPECPIVAVFVSDPEEVTEIPTDLLRCLYGLTPAEAALGCALARGLSLSEAAEQLGICRETARGRLKEIFGKTRTSRQAALVRLLLTGPAQLAAYE